MLDQIYIKNENGTLNHNHKSFGLSHFGVYIYTDLDQTYFHLFSLVVVTCNHITHPLEDRLREAAKQQVRRMCQLKKKRTYLDPPAWLVEAFQSQDKTKLAQLLMDCNFSKDWVSQGFEIVIKVFVVKTISLGIYIYVTISRNFPASTFIRKTSWRNWRLW